MKKNLLFVALLGGAIMMAAPQAQAAAPTATTFTPGGVTAAGQPDASSFSVTGAIPEFLLLSKVDNVLELHDLGGATLGGNGQSKFAMSTTQGSTGGSQSTSGQTHAFVKNTTNVASDPVVGEDGTAGVEIQSNAFVHVSGTEDHDVTNNGVDGAPGGGDDVALHTRLRGSVKGVVRYDNVVTGDLTSFSTAPSASGLTYDKDGYASYYEVGTYGASTLGFSFTFAPGPRPGGSGYGNSSGESTDSNAASGFRIGAEVDRHGLNDYKGTYSATIALSYSKW